MQQIQVKQRAVVERVKRKLRARSERLWVVRGVAAQRGWGRYALLRNNTVVDWRIDLEKLARELGALAPWEGILTIKEG